MLDDKKIGLIGGGMMAEAITRGLLKAGVEPSRITVSDPEAARREYLVQHIGVSAIDDNVETVRSADIVILAVKPFVLPSVLQAVCGEITPSHLLISIAAGITVASIESQLDENTPVVRAMPNTPCLIGAGAIAIAPGKYAESSHLDLAQEIFNAVGEVVRLSEDKLDAVTGLSGSGPAYVYMFIESLADGGVRMGLPRSVALTLAAQTVLGSAKMVLDTDEHPAQLRDRVTTPGGTTIAGTASLESDCFRSAVIEAVTKATERSAELGK